jgi:Fe-S-cluster containining protein
MMEQAVLQTSHVAQQLPSLSRMACAEGCCFCCYQPVDITALEALAMAAYLRSQLAAKDFDTLRTRLAVTTATLRELSYEAHAQAKIPCVLLVDGVCSVYPSRPFACRAWNSTSVARCQEIFDHGDPITMIPPIDMDVYETIWGVAQGLSDGLKHARLDSTSYELHSVLQRALDTPDAAQRWVQGEDVFAGCTVGAFAE